MLVSVEDGLIERARSMATELLCELGRRWEHVQGVAARAGILTRDLSDEERSVVVASAWVHDIGYSPRVAVTGFHPLDGARFLAADGFPSAVVSLVAYHSGAQTEAEERGLTDELAVYMAPSPLLLARLSAADMTTGPEGYLVAPHDRIAEILSRYEPDHPVHRAVQRSGPDLIANALAVEFVIAGVGGGGQPT